MFEPNQSEIYTLQQKFCQSILMKCFAFKQFIYMRKKNLRIRKPKHSSYTEPTSLFEMSEQSPQIDDLKKYLAELREEPIQKDKQLSSSFSFDFGLTEWKSNARLVDTVSLSSVYKSKNISLYQDKQQPVVEPANQIQSNFSVKITSSINQKKENDVPRRRKMLINLSKGRLRNKITENDTCLSRQKKWIKPSLYSLEQPRNNENTKLSLKKKIKLNFTSCRHEKTSNIFNFTKSNKIQFDKLQTLHGIHCFRNKFQLILNSRSIKRKDFKLFKCSTIRPLLNIEISTPKHT